MVTRPKGDNMIKRAHTEHFGFWEVGFDASVLTNERRVEGQYNMYWSNDYRYIGVMFPNVMYRMFECSNECSNEAVKHGLFKILSEVRAPLGAPGRSASIINSTIDRIVGCPDLDGIELVEDAATDYVPEFFD